MFPFLPLAIGVGSLVDGIFGASAQKSANEANIASAREQMQFQQYNSDTAYQRGVRDMKQAGLNPALAYSQGGASTPSGAAATSQPVNPLKGLGSSIASALEAHQTQKQIKKIESDTNLNNNIDRINKAQAEKTAAEAETASAEAVRAKQTSEFYKEHPWMVPLKETLGTANSALSTAGSIASITNLLKKPGLGKGTLSDDEKKILKQYNRYQKDSKKWDAATPDERRHLRRLD